ncbi:hypothetical protein EDC19_0906 [Natranaerovirga hydrolytica]|uniref:CoA-binding domain-containing protein n=1 Tax=Natranaerovirga hydrolytica TaxID=680378 RepID=A0A4R1N378_9FIRM|nr:CoA-binding protein [Natranaerovirga hydrolytica]TCK98484.1 hypothetical protein EDC19_0906 [Natranaerovirga hydrolytica]
MLEEKLLDQYKNWAVIGASTNPDKYGYKIYKKLKKHEYNVYGINPKNDTLEGDKLYQSLSELPEKVDVVNFVVNPKIGIEAVKECAKLGIKYIWLQPGAESDELIQLAQAEGIEVIQACVLVALSYRE